MTAAPMEWRFFIGCEIKYKILSKVMPMINPTPKTLSLMASCLISTVLLVGCGGGVGGSTTTTRSVNTPPPPPPPSTEFTITGRPFKGLMKNAEIIVVGSDSIIAEEVETLARGRTDPVTGNYSFVLDTASLPSIGDYIIVSVITNSATIICDAPIGCGEGIAFGDDLIVAAADNTTTPLTLLNAVVPTPANGSTTTINPNIFSHLSFIYFDDLLSQRTTVSFRQSEIDAGQTRVATIFGLDDAPFYTLPFVDLTDTVGSSNDNSIRAAMISGGIQSPLSEFQGSLGDGDGFAWGLTRLSTRFVRDDGEIRAREAGEFPGDISLEDIFEVAARFGEVNSTTTNAFSLALDSIQDSYAEVLASQAFALTSGGELTPPIPNVAPVFFGTGIQATDGDTSLDISSEVFDENGPDETIEFTLNESIDSDFFTLTKTGLLTPDTAFDCNDPKDADGNQVYELNITISDGELDTTQDMTLSIFAQDGSFCSNRGAAAKLTEFETNTAVNSDLSITRKLLKALE